MKDGRALRAKDVVSGCGYFNTFERLLPPGTVGPSLLKARRGKVEPSLSHMNLYVGLKASDQDLSLPKCNYWVYPTPDHDANIRNYVADASNPLPVVYLSFPSAKDPSFAERYPGRSTVQAISLAPYEWFARWADKRWHQRGADYETFKDQLTERLRAEMIRWVPQVKDHIEHCELSTPVSTQHFMNYSRGEPYGLAHTPSRFAQRWLRPQTSVRHLYLTGQDIATAGVGGALIGGVLTASALLRKNLISVIAAKSPAKVVMMK
jgi:all-trans-retinol 13,14-reductase